jgi:hypothetical protein
MIVPLWLSQLRRCLVPFSSSKVRNAGRRASVKRRVRLSLESLEDRFAPSADSVQTVANSLSTPFSEGEQPLSLTAAVTDTANSGTTVNEGTVTFTVKDSGGNTVGSAVTGPVSNGTATATFALPSDEAAGTYTIDVSYDDSTTGNFSDGGDTPGTLTVAPASVKVVGGSTSATFSTSDQSVTLTANLTDDSFPSDTVSEGTVTFMVKGSNGNTVGSAVTATVNNGAASAAFTLPANTAPGSYTIAVAYSDSTGTGNFTDDNTDSSGTLAVSAATTTTVSPPSSVSFSTSDQTVQLTTSVTSDAGTVDEGTVTFTILQGTTVIGTPTSGDVSNGSASGSYTLPGGTDAGSYTIEADYSDSSGNFADSSDNSQTLSVTSSTAAATTTTASNATATFSSSAQNVTLNATVTSSSGTVDEGTVTFTILQGTTVIGTATSGSVSNGSASVSYALPAGTAQGTYTIGADYSDSSGNFAISSDTTHTLTVNGLSTTTTASNATTAFSTSAQTVTLNATVTSSSGTVNEGTVNFTILQGATVISTATSGAVSNGSATAQCSLPAGTGAGTYTIEADYSDSGGGFADSSDNSHTLTVTSSTAASTTTTASDATATFSSSAQNVTLNATVTSSSGTVNGGTVNFTILQGNTVIGTATSGAVSNGSASVSYALPAGTAPGTYTIEADYNDNSGNFALSSDTAHTLTVSAASTTTTATSATATYSTSAQDVTLTATVTSSAGTVNEGSVQFTLTDSNGNTIGTATSGSVSNGSASVSYALPTGSTAGSYTIEADFSDSSGNFASSSDNTHTLTVSAASTTTTATSATATYSTSAQDVTLNATVTSSAGTVNEGSVTFTLVDSNGNMIGAATSGLVSNGSASASYALPANTAVGSYTIEANYSDSAGDFDASFDNAHTLAVNTASATKVSLTTININPNLSNGTAQVTLTAQVSNPGGTVNEGVLSITMAGVSGQGNVSNGSASVQLSVPLISLTNILTGVGQVTVSMSYSDNGGAASFTNSNASTVVSTNIWNILVPTNLNLDGSGNESMEVSSAIPSLLGFSYSASAQLTGITLASIFLPVTYANVGNNVVVSSIAGAPWGVALGNGNDQLLAYAGLVIDNGTPVWQIYDSNDQLIGEVPAS